MRIAVCDDEKDFRIDLKNKIYEYSNIKRYEMVVDEYNCGEALVSTETVYDIIFLDYKMGALDGLNTARILRGKNLNCAIIFLTNYPNFVYESFEVNTFRFYEKPLETDKLYKAMDDYFNKFGSDRNLILRCDREFLSVCTKDIVYVEAANKNCIIHLVEDKIHLSRTMAKVSVELPPDHFYKVHRAFIVNLNYIQKYNNGEISFKNGKTAYISRKYYTSFRTEYMRFSKNHFV